jgi:oligopeptide transport system substrate-binding protein
MDFPALVAHPVFRPVKVASDSLSKIGPGNVVTNGAFLLEKTASDRVLLARAENYWGRDEVSLERVSFVDTKNAEQALAAYRDGTVDVVTNAAFEPLAIKLLAPYEDFRRATYGALTYFNFNITQAPFDDIRVREALTIAIDRDRISQGDLGGATVAAKRFLPETMGGSSEPVVGKSDLLEKDIPRARQLLADAGFPDGNGFPKIRLLINRNEQQRIVAQAVASMWRSALNVETEISMKNWDEYEATIRAGGYDVVRRGLVMQTTDELTNMRMMFPPVVSPMIATEGSTSSTTQQDQGRKNVEKNSAAELIETEEQALRQLHALPIYFASSYALVKPYVAGFDSNVLDAPSLKSIKMDTTFNEPKPTAGLFSRRPGF